MKLTLRITSLAVVIGFTLYASASPLDYKTNVLDPPAPAATAPSYTTYILTAAPFTIAYTACASGELPGGITADGCFAAVNRTGNDWTSLQFTFPNTEVLHGQPASCAPAAAANIYSDTACGLDPSGKDYVLTFSNGVIKDGEYFFITEDGVVPADSFPTGEATVLTTSTPEPTSLLLLATGLLLPAFITWKARA